MGTNETVSPEALIARPSVGRIVHFYDGSTADPQAAIVTAVNGTHDVCLTVFAMDRLPYELAAVVPGSFTPPRRRYNVGRVPVSEKPTPGAWCWPPRT